MRRGFAETLKRAARLTRRDWLYLAIATKELLLARFRCATQPMGRILRGLRARGPAAPAREVDVNRLSWALGVAAARVPWRADCLLRAMAADRWLRRCGREPQFHLGVARAPGAPFGAHAWLFCDGVDVTGGDGGDFTVLISPSDDIS